MHYMGFLSYTIILTIFYHIYNMNTTAGGSIAFVTNYKCPPVEEGGKLLNIKKIMNKKSGRCWNPTGRLMI